MRRAVFPHGNAARRAWCARRKRFRSRRPTGAPMPPDDGPSGRSRPPPGRMPSRPHPPHVFAAVPPAAGPRRRAVRRIARGFPPGGRRAVRDSATPGAQPERQGHHRHRAFPGPERVPGRPANPPGPEMGTGNRIAGPRLVGTPPSAGRREGVAEALARARRSGCHGGARSGAQEHAEVTRRRVAGPAPPIRTRRFRQVSTRESLSTPLVPILPCPSQVDYTCPRPRNPLRAGRAGV